MRLFSRLYFALSVTISTLSLSDQLAAQTPAAPSTGAAVTSPTPNAPVPAPGAPNGGGGVNRGNRGPVATPPPAPPLPFVVERTLGGLKFDQPLGIVSPPGETNRLFILEKSGHLIVIPDLAKPERVTFLDLAEEIGSLDIERGLLALAFHPDYKNNHQFYLYFTTTKTLTPAVGRTPAVEESYDRLARFTTSATDPNKADRNSEQPLISQLDRLANHNGGELFFGNDGYLYLSLGDEGAPDDTFHNSQLIDHNFFSGLLRLDVDKRPNSVAPNPHPAVHPGTYAIPADNPWIGATAFDNLPVDPTKVRTEFYAVGLRNPWRMSIDRVTGIIWVADVGQELTEEIDHIRRGGNYGWNYREGDHAFFSPSQAPQRGRRGGAAPPPPRSSRVPPEGVTFDDPFYFYQHATGGDQCITGGFVYRGDALPSLKNRYIFADYISGRIWALSPVDGKGGEITVEQIARRTGIVSFGLDPLTGDILMANISSGFIEHLVPNPALAAPAAQ